MRRVWAVLAAGLVLGAGLVVAPPSTALLTRTTATLDPVLTEALAVAGAGDQLQAVAVLPRVPTPLDVAALEAVGLDAVPYRRLPMVAVQGTPAQLLSAAGLSVVRSLWGNHPLEEVVEQSTELIQADDAYEGPDGVTGAGVAIAVLDSGIDATHPDLALGTKTIQNVKLLGHKALFREALLTLEDQPNTDLTTGHGTHVAGIAAGSGELSGGRYAGVAPGAPLVGLGAADGVEMLTALAGYDWLLEHHDEYGIRVLNNSWADGTITYDPDDPLNVASRMAHDAGITVVFAAGNDGKAGGNVYNRYAWPDWVIGVAGADKLGRPGDYSSRGDDAHHPAVTAPGSFIASTKASTGIVGTPNQTPFDLTDPANPRMVPVELWPYYTVKLGTSMAAPHVAGVAALVLEADPGLGPDDVKRLLVSTATAIEGCGPADCGAGMVNALAAVQAARAAVNDAPVAVLAATPATGAAPLQVTLDAGGSSDPDGTVVAYRWDLDGDGDVDRETSGPTVLETYGAGSWTPSVVVIDDRGSASAPAVTHVRSSDAPTADADVPRHARAGAPVVLDASASSDPDGTIVTYHWYLGDGHEITTTSPTVSYHWSPARTATYAWALVVTDDAGVQDGVSGAIRVTP